MLGKARFTLCLALVLQISASHQVVSADNQKSTPPRGLAVFSALVSGEQYTHDGGRFDLFMQKVPGGRVVRLTDHRAHPKQNLGGTIREPKISRDGKKILFLSDSRNSPEGTREAATGAAPYPNTLLNVWMMKLPTRTVRRITKGDLGWDGIAWSPNGRYFSAVYQAHWGMVDQNGPIPHDIYVYDSQSGRLRKLLRMPDVFDDIFWYPDSKKVLFQSPRDAKTTSYIYSVAVTGGRPGVLIKRVGEGFTHSYSPNGRRVAFTNGKAVYIARANGSGYFPAIKLNARVDPADDWPRPMWSRAGDKLAAVDIGYNGYINRTTRLHVYDISGRKDRIVATIDHGTTGIIWSKDGRWIILKIEELPKVNQMYGHKDGLVAVSIADGRIVTLKEPNEETKGIDWVETD